MIPVQKIKENLRAKGLRDEDIDKIVEATLAVQKSIKPEKPKETTKMALLQEDCQCPSCKNEETSYTAGWLTIYRDGTSTFTVDETITEEDVAEENPKVAKTLQRYRLCEECYSRESVLTEIEAFLREHPKSIKDFQAIMEDANAS